MRFVGNGPDVPDELIRLHAEGKVVFFCGAGVSAHRGLPSFKKLINQIECAAGLYATKETTSLKRKGRYDLLLNSWEKKNTKQAIRTIVKDILLNKVKACTSEKSLHQAILDLSVNPEEKIHLVTTNFDRCFESFRTLNFPKTTAYSAPFLPIPKEGAWNGVVYLHGLLEENDDEDSLDNLVLTSGDFGRAYLYERWAARFVCELFRNYTVCFVGYSISDPVLRYLIDAINVDLDKGAVVNPAYIFVSDSEWSAEFESLKVSQVIKTIAYDNKQQHRYLNETLLAWADAHKSDGTGKLKIIKDYKGWQQPLPMQEIDFIKNMLWALNDKNGTGARLFAASPKASLKWAYPLLSTKFSDDSENIYRLKISNFGDDEPSIRDEVLWRWLCSYIDSYELMWIVCSHEGMLHPTFRSCLMDELKKFRKTRYMESNESKQLYRLWRFVLDKKVKRNELFWWDINDPIFNTSFQDESEIDEAEWAALKIYFSPSLKMEQLPSFKDTNNMSHFTFDLFWDDYLIGTKMRGVCKNLLSSSRLFLLIETSLKDGFNLIQHVYPNILYSLGWKIPSIQEHPQNRSYQHNGFVQMVFFLRDSWLSLAKRKPEFAREKFKEWISSQNMTFQRLALFVAQQFEIVPPNMWSTYLISSESVLLWGTECRREVCRLLTTTANRLTNEDLNKLIDVIMIGPSLKEEGIETYQNYAVWLRLKKIAISGAQLSPMINEKIAEFETKYDFKLSKWEKEEFNQWFSTNNDEDYKEAIQHIVVPADPSGIAQWLKDDLGPTKGFIPPTDNWSELCQIKPENVLAGLKVVYEKYGIINKSRIESCLSIWRKNDKFDLELDMVDFYLANLNDEKFGDLLEIFSRWFNAAPQNMQNHENLLFRSLNKSLEFYQTHPECLSIAESYYDIIYSPIGMQVNALMRILLSMQKEIRKNGLPDQYKKFFTFLCSNSDVASMYGCVILASYINALYSFDIEWTRKNLLPKFDMRAVKDSTECKRNAQWERTKLIWSGGLRCSRVNVSPIWDVLIEKGLFKIAEYVHENSKIEEQYIVCLIEMVFFYRHAEKSTYRRVFNELPQSALDCCLQKLANYQETETDKNTPEARWTNVSRFYKDILPRDSLKWSDEMKRNSINLLVDTKNAFEDAVYVVAPFIQGMTNKLTAHAITILSCRIKNREIISAKGVLDFCSIAVNVKNFDSYIYVLRDDLSEILNWIAETDDSLTKRKKYICLAEYVQKMNEKIDQN